jgi:hypothetical protein
MSTPIGWIELAGFLRRTKGNALGQILTDAKKRTFEASYSFQEDGHGNITIRRSSGSGDSITIPSRIPLDRELVAFFGLYSGDGAKGSEQARNPGKVTVSISFSQSEPNIIKFVMNQFNRLFPNQLRFTFSLGEDSAYFMDGEGLQQLKDHYGGELPALKKLSEVQPELDAADERYLSESRDVKGTNEDHLAFYYQHKQAMQAILTLQKSEELSRIGIRPGGNIKVTSSLRRPFKKGARLPGGSSRADEMHLGGVNGMGELFLKILYELETSLYEDKKESPQGLVRWDDTPSKLGERLNTENFFRSSSYTELGGERPTFKRVGGELVGLWPRSSEQKLNETIHVDPLFSYAAGLYLAEGATTKSLMFAMYTARPNGLSVEFTSSEDYSMSIILRAMSRMFPKESVLTAWKIKVGSQYFTELVAIGLKHGVPMLRGGASGDGKLRTMEISLALKNWGLQVYPSLGTYADLYSHVEPTGAGVARAHFWASSVLGKWLFPVMLYATFSNEVANPKGGFIVD